MAYQNFDEDDHHYNRKLGRHIYGVLSLQLIVATLLVVGTYYSPDMVDVMVDNSWIFMLCLVVSAGIVMVAFCFKHFARKHHRADFLYLVFTASFGLLMANLTIFFNPWYVLSGILIVTGVAISLAVYSFSSRNHFKDMAALLVGLVVGGLVMLFDFWYLIPFELYYLVAYSVVVVGCALHLVVNGQVVIREGRHHLKHKHFALGALLLYVDWFGFCC